MSQARHDYARGREGDSPAAVLDCVGHNRSRYHNNEVADDVTSHVVVAIVIVYKHAKSGWKCKRRRWEQPSSTWLDGGGVGSLRLAPM